MDRETQPKLWHRLVARFHHLRGMAHRSLGNLQGDRLEFQRAVADYDRAIQRDPTFVQALFDRAVLLWREHIDCAQAERDLTRVLELSPGRTEAWFNRAFARQAMGDVPGAVADFERYLLEGNDPMWQEISREQITILSAIQPARGENAV